ncbi:hypothetical protein DXG03_000332 [Asterophora parasitica]|uniref:Uncharacterized protein n=1 Tax=Asterophora parasitica TaxID=117018 RepID=A0A9P7GFA3_9AGAR|nr:hypothetical protein DXG03_000332 [Asterophora parasitica]
MDFIPRYAQPFTLAEAVTLDVAHLKQTQTGLQEYIDSEPPEDVDPEITKALEENKTVIGSQEERILILKLALSEKGVHYGSHYELNSKDTTSPAAAETPSTHPSTTATETSQAEPDDEGGVYL